MTSYTSSSDPRRPGRGRVAALFAATAVLLAASLGAAEMGARHYRDAPAAAPGSVADLMRAMPGMRLSGREVGNQMLVHNVALFARHPLPSVVSRGYVGTSRSKVLRPGHFGIHQAVVGAGNTYNEVSYGLLAQAEILRLQFPNMKTVFVEASFLLRRPGRFIVEDDHRKYLPIIRSFEPLCREARENAACLRVFGEIASAAVNDGAMPATQSALVSGRSRIRFSTLFGEATGQGGEEGTPVLQDPWFQTVDYNGERKDLPQRTVAAANQRPKITKDNVKVQRLREIAANRPWDGLYDLFGAWGREHGIEVVFFQPPVRSDLYGFQVEQGLREHVADMERVSKAYGFPFIDLDRPELGYMDDWSLFSDEDHMDTCLGSGLLTLALDKGLERFKTDRTLDPVVPRAAVEAESRERLAACG